MRLKGLIFDLDGTIVDAPYDWGRIRAHLDTGGQSVLEFLRGLAEPEKSRKWEILKHYEREATEKAVLKSGAQQLMRFLSERRIRTALVSNNSQANVDYLLTKFNLRFERVLARDSGLWKPAPDPFLAVLREWELKGEECGVVGDAMFDVLAAAAAGIRSMFIVNRDRARFEGTGAEVYGSLPELQVRLAHMV